MATVYQESITLELLECCNCGVAMGIPESFVKRRREDGNDFWCPNGHAQGWHGAKSGMGKLKAEAQQERERREAAERQALALQDQLAAAERERKRHAKRAKNGVCPCCNRSFAQLARHMKNQHPEYA
jgi:hypothetical protein